MPYPDRLYNYYHKHHFPPDRDDPILVDDAPDIRVGSHPLTPHLRVHIPESAIDASFGSPDKGRPPSIRVTNDH